LKRVLAFLAAALCLQSQAATIEESMMMNIAIKCGLAAEMVEMFNQRRDDPTWDNTAAYKSALQIMNDYEPGSPDASRLALWSSRDMYLTLLRRSQATSDGKVPNSIRQVSAAMCAMELYRFVGGDRSGLARIR
jgi:hypothetical protein